MALCITDSETCLELSIPLHNDIDFLVKHLKDLTNKLEMIKNQNLGIIESIALVKSYEYLSLNISIRKNLDFNLNQIISKK